MSQSNEFSRPKPAGASAKKSSTQFEELSFLSTPSKVAQKPLTVTPSGEKASVAFPKSVYQDAASSPFSPSSRHLPPSASNKSSGLADSIAEIQPLLLSSVRTTFVNRPEPFKTIETLNAHLPEHDRSPLPPRPAESRLAFSLMVQPEKYQFRYMFEKLSDRSDVLDRQIEHGGAILAEWYGIEEWSDPSLVSQEDIWAVGRICAETQDSKLTEQACWLETSRLGGYGRRVWLQWNPELRVHGVGLSEGGIGLFPGAIVGVRGRNGSGNYFSVQEIFSMPVVDPPMTLPHELLKMIPSVQSLPITFSVACGPFTWDDDLDFLPLEALVEQFVHQKLDVIILLGPFVDANHPMIKAGKVDKMPSTIFREKVGLKLQRLIESCPSTQVLVIPSPRDLVASHCVYPQAGLDVKNGELGLGVKGVTCLPNPVMFTVNEVVIGINNVDVLMPLRKEEYFKSAVVVDESEVETGMDPNGRDIISRACRHVMRQRRFYPLFPAVTGVGVEPINLDLTHPDLLRYDPVGCDILILPTSFTAFSKIIDSTVVVNPRQVCKAKGTGTYAKLTIYGLEKETVERAVGGGLGGGGEGDEEPLDHLIYERCRVDLIKI